MKLIRLRMGSLAATFPTAIALGLFSGACDKNPTAPTPTTDIVTGALTIEGPGAILAGTTTPYQARVTLSNGTVVAVTPTWTSSDPSVATVEPNGSVAGRGPGSVQLDASFEGIKINRRLTGTLTASKTVDVVPNVQGRWIVSAVVHHCDEEGAPVHDFWPTCREIGLNRWGFQTSLQLSHHAVDPRQVSAQFNLAGVEASVFGHCEAWYDRNAPLAGDVSSDGDLSLEGTGVSERVGYELFPPGTRWTLRGDTRLVAPGELRGRWALEVSVTSGRSYWEFELVSSSTTARHDCESPAVSKSN